MYMRSINNVVRRLTEFSGEIRTVSQNPSLNSAKISGPSGCGKSSLIESFLSSNLDIAAKSLHLSNNFDLPCFTVGEVVSTIAGVSSAIEEHLFAMELGTEFMANNYNKSLETFSVGERQRFSLATLLSSRGVADCEYIWLDEGLSGVQPALVSGLVEYLNAIGMGVFLVHHGLIEKHEFGWEITFK